MKNEKSIPEQTPELSKEDVKREEDLKAAAKRRENYAVSRDAQAKEENEAIARRLAKEKAKEE